MKIRKLKIRNFRGIKELDWCLPNESVFCLIGKGDSSKSTIVDSIHYAFYPQWNLSLNDTDFYNCSVDEPIVIEVCIGELSDAFCSLDKFGKYFQGWDPIKKTVADEPSEGLEDVLTIRLTIGKDLEPKWIVVCPSKPEGVEFKTADRVKVSVGVIGIFSDRQLSWGNGTALAKLTEAGNLNESLAQASRSARNSLDEKRAETLKNFDDAALKSQTAAQTLGVPVHTAYKAHLDLNALNIRIGGLALHDGDIPLRQLGLGSRRMLLCGIQTQGLAEGHITIFDEIEFGLEPHRIARLIKHIKADQKGQFFMTTHSPVVIRELSVKDLYIVHKNDGKVEVLTASDESLAEHEVQGKIRAYADAFLSKKVLVCEGKTEVGFMRGFDDYQMTKGKDPFSYHGIALVDAGGAKNVVRIAKAFHSIFYPVAVLADGDSPANFSPADETTLNGLGVNVQTWNDCLSLEERAMMDLPWKDVLASVKLAHDEFSVAVEANVSSVLNGPVSADFATWVESDAMRKAIGLAAKKSDWFKDITKGEAWLRIVSPAFESADFQKKDLAIKMNALWTWAEKNA